MAMISKEIRKNLNYMGIFRRAFLPLPIIPQGGPITKVLVPTLKQLKFGWIVDNQQDINLVERKISHCKRCNIQNEYIDYNPNYLCYSCKS